MAWAVYTSSLAGGGFSPLAKVQALYHQLHQTPRQFGELSSRWTLKLIQKVCTWLSGYSLSGIWRVLCALKLHYKRGQQQVHSPDPEYESKRQQIQTCIQATRERPDEVVTVFEDEFSFYRWPTVAPVYAPAGRNQPPARMTPGYNTRGRVAIALNVFSGRVTYRQRAHLDVPQQIGLLQDLRRDYPGAKAIYFIQDNWHNVHFHPDQCAAAERLSIALVPLPTYAPWLNPVEKVGRKMRQEVTHMHDLSEDWPTLKDGICAFLDQFANGSSELLRYVGLLSG